MTGTAGMRAIKQRGGITIVQDPVEAVFPSMPANVMRSMAVDYALPLAEIAPTLNKLARQPAEEERGYPVAEDVGLQCARSISYFIFKYVRKRTDI